MSYVVHWTDEMVDALRSLREKAVPLQKCATRVGVAYGTAVRKARELDIAQRMNLNQPREADGRWRKADA